MATRVPKRTFFCESGCYPWLEAIGIGQPKCSNVAAVAGVSPKSSSFKNDVSRLSSLGSLRNVVVLGAASAIVSSAAPALSLICVMASTLLIVTPTAV